MCLDNMIGRRIRPRGGISTCRNISNPDEILTGTVHVLTPVHVVAKSALFQPNRARVLRILTRLVT
jgi:hypothetical protein